MDLPPALRAAVDAVLDGVPLAELRTASRSLSDRYRAELKDGKLHLSEALAVKAYLAARLPATYAAIRASLSAIAGVQGDFAPTTLLDVGAGPGTALWAAADCWQSLERAAMIEASEEARQTGAALASDNPPARMDWISADVTRGLPSVEPADLVTLCYVLDELAPSLIAPLVERLWSLTKGTLLIVEPGTPAGWRRIVAVRAHLLALGATLVAPCPHHAPCPLAAPDWCHFSRRVARTKIHRLTKDADVPWEDEKYSFVAATRLPVDRPQARVLAPPHPGKGRVSLKLCQEDGSAVERLVTKREGPLFAVARRLDWGDALWAG